MAHYFVDNLAATDGAHGVHAAGCSDLPNDKRYLGNFYNVDEALIEARKDFWQLRGCEKCANTGFSGRRGIYELLLMDHEIRQLALKNTDANSIKSAAVQRGMRTLRDDGAAKVLAGVTTIEEVMMATAEDKH